MTSSNSEDYFSHTECKPRLIDLQSYRDSRGKIIVGEFSEFPFNPQRFFLQEVDSAGIERGGHAHLICQQFMIPLSGTILANIQFCGGTIEFQLQDSNVGLYLPKMVWATQTFATADAKTLVLASEPFEESDYIRDKSLYEKLLSTH